MLLMQVLHDAIMLLKKVPQMLENGKIGEEAGTRIVCEAKFIRALFYNHLTSLYRDVPEGV